MESTQLSQTPKRLIRLNLWLSMHLETKIQLRDTKIPLLNRLDRSSKRKVKNKCLQTITMIEIESKPNKKDLVLRLPLISWQCKKRRAKEKNLKKRKLPMLKKNSEKL